MLRFDDATRRPALTHVAAAWAVSRIVGFIALVVTPTPDGRWVNTFGLTTMDGNWFRSIVDSGYPRGAIGQSGTAWPFFPLYPWLAGAATKVGLATGPSLIGVSWLMALVALVGVFELVRSRFDPSTAVLTVWLSALLPGSIGWVLSYSDTTFVAGAVWSLVVADRVIRADQSDRNGQSADSRWWLVGLIAVVATLSRPNGFLVVIALAVAVAVFARRAMNFAAVSLPSAIALVIWTVFCHSRTGDWFVFMTAKDAWLELNLFDFIKDPWGRPPVFFHVCVLLVVVAIAAKSLRRLPPHWNAYSLLIIGPSAVLGVEGLARYTSLATPLVAGVALSVASQKRAIRVSTVVVAAIFMAFLGVKVVRTSWVP